MLKYSFVNDDQNSMSHHLLRLTSYAFFNFFATFSGLGGRYEQKNDYYNRNHSNTFINYHNNAKYPNPNLHNCVMLAIGGMQFTFVSLGIYVMLEHPLLENGYN